MKTIITTISLLLILTITANADTVKLDGVFTKAQKWLEEKNLTITGGSNGTRDDVAAFSQEALLFYGEGVGSPDHRTPAQRELMTKRAAVITAQRALLEYLEGFVLIGTSTVKDGMALDDLIVSVVGGFAKGSQVVFQEYSKETDTAIAIIKLGMHGPNGFATAVYEKMSSNPKLKETLKTDSKPFIVRAVELDGHYDGLIIDATDQKFRPALINRIFAVKGDVLYDPAKNSQKVLVEQGCGEYTDSIDKAKAALANRGVKCPLVIKASGTVSVANLQVNDDDAVKVYSADQKNGFMAAAKVAFVLK